LVTPLRTYAAPRTPIAAICGKPYGYLNSDVDGLLHDAIGYVESGRQIAWTCDAARRRAQLGIGAPVKFQAEPGPIGMRRERVAARQAPRNMRTREGGRVGVTLRARAVRRSSQQPRNVGDCGFRALAN
jgi:hypothetical protein